MRCSGFQDTFEARFSRVTSVETPTPVVNAGAPAKDESSDESSSEDDSESIEREKQLAALQQQVLACHLYSVRQKKVSPKVFCHFLSNRSEFLHEISHIYYSFIVA